MKKSHLLVPIHARTLSSPVKLISNFDSTVHHHHKRYPSSVDQSGSENHFKNDKKLSLDSYLTNRCASDEKSNIKRSLDEIQLPSQDSLNRNFVLNTPETPNTRSSGELLLAQLLKGSSEKLLNEQNLNNKKSISASTLKTTGSGGIALPAAVLKYLVSPLNSTFTRIFKFKKKIEFNQEIVSIRNSMKAVMLTNIHTKKHLAT